MRTGGIGTVRDPPDCRQFKDAPLAWRACWFEPWSLVCGDVCRREWGHPPWGKHEAALWLTLRTAEWSSSGAAACVRDRLGV